MSSENNDTVFSGEPLQGFVEAMSNDREHMLAFIASTAGRRFNKALEIKMQDIDLEDSEC